VNFLFGMVEAWNIGRMGFEESGPFSENAGTNDMNPEQLRNLIPHFSIIPSFLCRPGCTPIW
jgi:hypothetical protein